MKHKVQLVSDSFRIESLGRKRTLTDDRGSMTCSGGDDDGSDTVKDLSLFSLGGCVASIIKKNKPVQVSVLFKAFEKSLTCS
mmetsp:Transcript_22736/g.41334  ORF Transcript_22736/g.41334 Transcript_22736/m.41334 type:complete len:82 (-) Transcript_22736:667-912(-)